MRIFEQIISHGNLFAAWRVFRRGKRSRRDVQIYERRLEDNVFALAADLRFGRYQHGPYQKFHIFDPKHRVIHKATVRDRLVHHAIHRVVAPVLERSFISDSYSCRIGKGTHAALRQLGRFTRKVSHNFTRPCWALKCDIRRFFDSVSHEILLDLLKYYLRDQRTHELLSEIISSHPPVDNNAERERERELVGIPIGNLTSQLFANVYLNQFDHFVKEQLRVRFYLRYTDDFIFLHDDPAELVSLLPSIRQFLNASLRLNLHKDKIILRKLRQGIDFLGYVTLTHHRVLRTKTKQRMFRRVQRKNFSSYSGLLNHCRGRTLRLMLVRKIFRQ